MVPTDDLTAGLVAHTVFKVVVCCSWWLGRRQKFLDSRSSNGSAGSGDLKAAAADGCQAVPAVPADTLWAVVLGRSLTVAASILLLLEQQQQQQQQQPQPGQSTRSGSAEAPRSAVHCAAGSSSSSQGCRAAGGSSSSPDPTADGVPHEDPRLIARLQP